MTLVLHSNRTRTIAELEDLIRDIAAQPEDGPIGLIGQHYVDSDFFEHEKRTYLKDGWHCRPGG